MSQNMTIVDGLVRQLRATGIGVGLTEHLDATRAVTETDVFDRDALRAALRTTLVKDVAHFPTFDLVFDLYFGGSPIAGPATESGTASTAERAAESAGESASPIDQLPDEQLRGALASAVHAGDSGLVRRIVSLMVDRYAGFTPGLPVGGAIYQLRTMRAIGSDELRSALLAYEDLDAAGPVAKLERRLAADRADEGVRQVEREVEAEVRRRLVADRGADAVAKSLRRPLPEDVDFLLGGQRETDALRTVVQPLARKLAGRLEVKRKHGSNGTLDFRRTIRRSLSYGGVLAEPVFRPKRPAKPRLVVLADISGSVATFAAFTLRLVHALRGEFAAVRSFVFVDGVDEVTGLFAEAADLGDVVRTINEQATGVWLDGRSDYGHVLESFLDEFATGLTSRTTVLILGDARTNHHEPRADALAAVAARAGHVYWLNPEPRVSWDTGDSVIGKYAPHCDNVVECRSVRQLRAFVESLG